MKKLILLLTISSLFLVACKKDKDENPEPFSQLTVEQNKEVIEIAGIEMVNTMDDMKDLDAIEVCVNLAETLDSADPTASKPGKKSKLAYTVDAIAGIASDDYEFNAFFNDMKYGVEIEDPESIQDLWEEIVGTYTWNSEMQDWDYSENSSEVVLLFPAMDNSTSNDGKLRIYGYMGVFMNNPLDDEYSGDLPTDIAFEISVNNTVLVTYTFGVNYNEEGIPSALASDLSIPPFKWEVDMTNNDTDVTLNYKFTHNNEIVLEVGGGAKGLFTQANVDANTVLVTDTYYYYDWVYNPMTGYYEEVLVEGIDEWEEVEFEEIINSSEAHFQMFNILINGEVNIKALVDQIRIIEDAETEDWTDADYTKETEDIVVEINKNINLRVINADDNSKIAEIEAYVVTETNSWGEDSWIDFRFVFSDGSTIDAETYFDEGFENFVDEINALIADINAEYDANIDPIDY
ncbi:MAG: hypothetical protein K9H49_04980 [Bacteroidales bacterium]|nr:hypothetical protein [Bacteroidales bacterium]MCF8391249.1 hypothetical protein [Bacteroidales bacterium]